MYICYVGEGGAPKVAAPKGVSGDAPDHFRRTGTVVAAADLAVSLSGS